MLHAVCSSIGVKVMQRQSKRIRENASAIDPNKIRLDGFLKIMSSALANDGIERVYGKAPREEENVSVVRHVCVLESMQHI